MERLSSCYFCGTALDEPLQDYPLVAGDTGEHGAVVTLCPGCHHKLETVLDVVVGEAEDLPALEDAGRAALEGEEPAALTEPEAEESAADERAPEPIALGDGEENDGEERTEASVRSEASDAASVADADSAADVEGETPTDAETEPEVDAGSDTEIDGQSGDRRKPDASTGGDPADGGRDGSGGGTDPDREVTATVSALEYNKVMRLLQNREFPVDRAEIEAVATSAYELSKGECAAVIDLAVDRGLVVERDGQLVRPDE